jgi:hypothetical protein
MKFEYLDLQTNNEAYLYAKPKRKRGRFNGFTKYGEEIISHIIRTDPILLDDAVNITAGDQELAVQYFEPVDYGVYISHIDAFFIKPLPGSLGTFPPQAYPIVGEFSECAPYKAAQ